MPVGIGGGVGAIVVVIIGLFLGIDPSTLMAVLNGAAPDAPDRQPASRPASGYGSSRPPDVRAGGEDHMRQFVSVVLADTEDVWRQTFGDMGRNYRDPKLVLYSDVVHSPCGMASSATGPFYCPNDQKVYLDTAFFDDMKRRMHASGEFAQAYVIAHEIGHHVQNELGHSAEGKRRARTQRPAHARTRSRCASNCRPTALPASGRTTPTAPSISSNRAMSRRR